MRRVVLSTNWILAPDFKLIGDYEHGRKEYPSIKVGEDFKGYKKSTSKSTWLRSQVDDPR